MDIDGLEAEGCALRGAAEIPMMSIDQVFIAAGIKKVEMLGQIATVLILVLPYPLVFKPGGSGL